MSCTLAGASHCSLSCGDQATSKAAETNGGESLAPHHAQVQPSVVAWEATQACDLKCPHCRAHARPHRHPLELSTVEAFHLIDQIAAMKAQLFWITGGDPLKRADILPIVQYATRREVKTALTPSTTPLLVREVIFNLKESGLTRLAISVDGSTAELHDAVRGMQGSYKRSLDAVNWCHAADLAVQVNTTISRRNFADLDNLIELVSKLRAVVWNVFFLVPTGPLQADGVLTAEEHEQVFAKLHNASQRAKFEIKTTEGQHYLRYVIQQQAKQGRPQAELIASARLNLHDGRDFVFVSHTGEVHPSGFLPLSGGNILWEPLSEICLNSSLFRSLRDPEQLKGKCGVCEFKECCGGSRARAYAVSKDPLAQEPFCAYTPAQPAVAS